MREARAFSPCHITGFFQILDQPTNPLYVGSRGAGVSLRRGVETVVKIRKGVENSLKVKINGSTSNSAEVSEHVVNTFLSRFKEGENFNVTVEHHVGLPIGGGFGTSGAAALSLALALNHVFGLDMPKTEVAQLAHVAEVECRTGLGTVIAETYGGVEIRVKPGAPGIGEIKHVPVPRHCILACLNFNSLPTKEFLTDDNTREHINEFGGELVDRLIEESTTTNFMKFSHRFAEQVGLITDQVREVLDATDSFDFLCSMPIFGESVFALTGKEFLPQLLKIFERFCSQGRVIVSEINFEGARPIK